MEKKDIRCCRVQHIYDKESLEYQQIQEMKKFKDASKHPHILTMHGVNEEVHKLPIGD